MEKYFEEVNGKKFPVRVVPVPEEWGCGSPLHIADYELWCAIEWALKYNSDEEKKNELNALDNEIYYYCDSMFIASDPTDEQIVKYLKPHLS